MTADLNAAKAVIDIATEVVDQATRKLAAAGDLEANQVIAYDLAHAAATVDTGRAMLGYGEKGDLEAKLACAYIADLIAELAPKLFGREAEWGVEPNVLDEGIDLDQHDPAVNHGGLLSGQFSLGTVPLAARYCVGDVAGERRDRAQAARGT